MLRAIPLLLCAVFSSTTHAAGKWYQIEVLAFDQANAQRYASEQWPTYPGFPDVSSSASIRAHSPTNQSVGFTEVPSADWNFNDSHRLLNQQKDIRVLFHTRWRQYLDKEEDTFPVHLYGGAAYGKAVEPTAPRSLYPRFETFTTATMTQSSQQRLLENTHPWELEGRLAITLSRYLHMDADFVFQKPIQQHGKTRLEGMPVSAKDWAQRANVQLQPFRLTQSLRMRSKEVHYLDHPMFGLLIRVTPEEA